MINKGCADHAIDSYGLFLVFYSSDIAPIGVEDFEEDTRTKWQRRLDEEEEKLSNGEIDSWGVAVEDDYF
jgi:RNA polymerase-interacting CarD/CdnL/TRCF family regulator